MASDDSEERSPLPHPAGRRREWERKHPNGGHHCHQLQRGQCLRTATAKRRRTGSQRPEGGQDARPQGNHAQRAPVQARANRQGARDAAERGNEEPSFPGRVHSQADGHGDQQSNAAPTNARVHPPNCVESTAEGRACTSSAYARENDIASAGEASSLNTQIVACARQEKRSPRDAYSRERPNREEGGGRHGGNSRGGRE